MRKNGGNIWPATLSETHSEDFHLGSESSMLLSIMRLDPTARRRWLGGLALFAAAAMLICGLTVLQGRLSPSVFVLYWPICFLFTGLAVLMALRDFRALQQRAREEQRELLESTLKDIELEARRKTRKPGRNGRP